MYYLFEVEPIPGQDLAIGDKSGRYRIRRYSMLGSVKDKTASTIIDSNLPQDEAYSRCEELNKASRPES